MPFCIRSRVTAIGAVLMLFLSCGPFDAADRPCGSESGTGLLKSKTDDDDGDGNPLDEDFPRINDEDDDIADHAWCKDPHGVYHLFFQNEDHGTGDHIEHYVSTDLSRLDYAGVALQANPGGWDSFALWAPHVVRSGDTYFMFYTGTNGPGSDPNTVQRIGLAISHDLTTWTRVPVNNCSGTSGDGCVYECAECWTTWGKQPGSYNQQCRDPFVLWDADRRRWVLFATAKSVGGSGVVTVAYSTNLTGWTGAGYIDATRQLASGAGGQTTGGQAENAFVMTHAGIHYLMFTDWRDPEDPWTVPSPRTIVQYATSSTLTADSSGSANWVYRGYTPDPGVNAIEVQVLDGATWVQSQSIANPDCPEHTLHRRELRLKQVVWGRGFSFGTEAWPCAASLPPPGRRGPPR